MEIQKISKNIGLLGLVMSGLTCIIGSGWLFGAFQATKVAGPSAIFSWIIDGGCMLFLVFTFAELGSMMPRVGGMVRYMEYTHGSLAGFINAWANWLAIISVIAVEAVASTQYLSSVPLSWTHHLVNAASNGLSNFGIAVATLFLVLYFLVNYWSVKLFVRFVVVITVVKIVVPVLTVFFLLYTAFHPSNFTAYQGTMAPYGWAACLTAIATSGVALAYRGFQTIVNLSGEAKNPGRNVPLAMFLSIIISMGLYVLLQVAFIGAIDPQQVMNGWHNLSFQSPYADLAIILNLHVLLISIYLDAILSPSGVGIAYLATTSRMLYGMSHNGYMPKFMGELHPKYQIPRKGLWFNLIISFAFIWVFKGWSNLVPLVSVLGVIAFFSGPISSSALRWLAPNYPRPIRMRGLNVASPIAFIVISLIVYWAKWPLTAEVNFLIGIGLVFYVYYQNKLGWPLFKENFKAGIWFVVYLFVIALLSYVGSDVFGGKNYIPFGWDMAVVSIVSLFFFFWGVKSAWMNPVLKAMLENPEGMKDPDAQFANGPVTTAPDNKAKA